MKWRFVWVLALAFWAASVWAQEPVTLRVGGAFAGWGIPDPNATSPFERARRRVFEEFSRTHPGIKLERFTALNIQGPAAESGIVMAFAGGTAPDIVYVNMRLMRQYSSQGFLQPLDDFLARDPGALDHAQASIRRELNIDGHVYAVPSAQFVQALYYRKDLFRDAGLDPNRPPRNWDEFYSYAQKLTNFEKGQWGFVLSNDPVSYHWLNFLYAAGGDVVVKNASGQYQAAFDNEAGLLALNYFRKLLLGEWKDADGKTRKGVATKSATMKVDISAGKVGMWFAYQSDDIANMNQYDLNPSLVGIAAMPKGPSGKSANELNASMWGVNASVTDPRKRAAAWEFVKFMGSETASRVRVTAYVENGLGNLVNPVELKKWGYDEYITAPQRAWLAANKTLFANGKPEPNGPNMAFIYQLLNEPLDQAILYPDRDARRILRESAGKINAKLLNYTPPETMRRNRAVANGVASVLALILAFFTGRWLLGAFRGLRRGGPRSAGALPFSVHVSAWLFMAPAVLSIAFWAYLPLLRGMLMAFQDYRILGDSRFIGLDNFIEAATQEMFWIGVKNAFVFTAWLLGMGFFLPIVLALMLHEIPKGKVVFRVLFYLPAVTTSVVVAMLFKQFFDPSDAGLANTVKALLDPIFSWIPGWPDGAQKWLQDPAQAKFAIVLPLVWAGAGPGSIIYLAALQGIPDEMYEAADLDGAGFFTKIFRITLPTLSPLIVINLVGATIGAFKIMEPVLVQTGGGPDNATHTIGLEVWYNAFMYLKFGYATAAAWMMGVVLIALTLYQLRMLRSVRYSSAGR